VFTSAKGNYRYARLFYNQKTESFLESHASFFEQIKGVYHLMVYDNTRVVVKKFVGPSEKEPTEALIKLSLYYGFNYRFCNVQAGWEKGNGK
jgi:transposase